MPRDDNAKGWTAKSLADYGQVEVIQLCSTCWCVAELALEDYDRARGDAKDGVGLTKARAVGILIGKPGAKAGLAGKRLAKGPFVPQPDGFDASRTTVRNAVWAVAGMSPLEPLHDAMPPGAMTGHF